MVRFENLLPAADTSLSDNEDLSHIMQKLDNIDNEVAVIHNFIRENYGKKFPELETLVQNPIDYARIVKRIGNELCTTLVDIDGLLPLSMAMMVSIVASASNDNPLPEDVLRKTIDACDKALALDSEKKKVLDFLQNRMDSFVPNLSAVIGHVVSAKLTGAAGGLSALAILPACSAGRALREGVQKKIEKWQELPGPAAAAAKKPKLLSVHEVNPKKKRKMKEIYGESRLRKLANTMLFGVPDVTFLGY